jgi:hypothetical protein
MVIWLNGMDMKELNKIKRGWGKIKSIGKIIDSAIPPLYLLILAYLLILTTLIAWGTYTTK